MAATALSAVTSTRTRRYTGLVLLAGYLALYAGTLYFMSVWGGFDASEALGIAAVLGVGFSLAAWLLTLRSRPLIYDVLEPAKEVTAILVYMLPLTAFVTWGFDLVRRMVPNDPAQAVALVLVKLAIFVAIPAWLMRRRFGYFWCELAPRSFRRSHMVALVGIALLILAFQSVAGRGLRDIRAAHISATTLLWGIPVTFFWLVIEAGVVEEFFFRCLLQSRLSAALRSRLGAIVVMSLLFGLMHAPGLYLRTAVTQEGLPAHPTLWMAIGYSIVITSVAGFFLGVLWARTRNFAVVVAVHAAADLLPDFLSTLHSLHLLR
jgi:membrane protease YdiL (CAAX protease family)